MNPPLVSILVITYNQENFIKQALDSILSQKTNFSYRIYLANDASTDSTGEICAEYKNKYPEKIVLINREENVGLTKNFLETYKICNEKYVALLEGDDFWTCPLKLQKQVDFLEKNPDFAICFHNVYFLNEETGKRELLFKSSFKEIATTEDLCRGDFISTPSCVFRNKLIKEVPSWLYKLDGVDWAFDIVNSEYGKIGYLDEPMACYRVHSKGAWSGLGLYEKRLKTIELIEQLDKGFDQKYTSDFKSALSAIYYENIVHFLTKEDNIEALKFNISQFGKFLEYNPQLVETIRLSARNLFPEETAGLNVLPRFHKIESFLIKVIKKLIALARIFENRITGVFSSIIVLLLKTFQKKLDLIILDDVFPHPLSAFRMAEYCYYLSRFENMKILSSGASISCFNEKKTINQLISDFKNKNPFLKRKIQNSNQHLSQKVKLAYVNFLGNINQYLEFIEQSKIPFLFTLYPGGSFRIGEQQSDLMLQRVVKSKFFKKVIVTQSITKDYLLKKGFCQDDQIEMIYGMCVDPIFFETQMKEKSIFQETKETFDICFVAHKYMSRGIDKGYDKFIASAKILSNLCPSIRFHVIGGFSEKDIDIDEIKNKMVFYGHRRTEELINLYRDMDLIVSPNKPFVLFPGAFDGFPTGCCMEASLCGVGILCTDYLECNEHFSDDEIVIIPSNDPKLIVDKIEYFYNNPSKLYKLAKKGSEKMKDLLSPEKQLLKREELIRSFIK